MAWSVALDSAAQFMRPSAEYRPMGTDRHEVVVQKNGRVDVFLRNGMPLFSNAYPMVWLEGEPEAKALKVDGRATTREEFRDRLGVAQNMVFHHKTNQWSIRVYPLEPFITVQVAYINATRKPVRVKALVPWAVGGRVDGAFTLGPRTGDARVLRYPDQRLGGTGPRIDALGQGIESDWMAALVNPADGRPALLGFLSAEKGWPRIVVTKSADTADALAPIQALSVYDPPVTVEPGGRLESETLYLSLSDPDAYSLLERFGQAFGVANGLQPGAQRPAGEVVSVEGAADMLRPDAPAPEGRTRVEAYRAVLAEARQTADGDAPLVGRGPVFLDGPHVAGWRANAAGNEAIFQHARQYFLTPWVYRPVMDGAEGEAGMAAAALNGALWTSGEALIASERPYRPADLFVADRPRIWTRTYGDLPGGPLHMVAVFNWGDAGESVTVALDQAGLAADGFYTVYEPAAQRYAGTVTERLTLETAAGGVRLVALRPFRETPQVVAVEPAPLNEKAAMTEIAWSPADRTLHGTTGDAGAGLTVHIAVPGGFAASATRLGGKPVRARQDGNTLLLPIPAGTPAGAAWEVRF